MPEKGLGTTTPWKGSCESPSAEPPRVAELRIMGKSVSIARRTYYEAVSKDAYRKNTDDTR